MFRPALGTGGKVVAYFGLAKPVTGGMPDVLVVDQSWIDARRKAGGGNSSAWKEWPEEMALKTVVKALANAAPKSTRSERLAVALASDGVVRTELDGTPDEHATAYADDDVVDGEVID
jgi:recombinational DNA repair protein RecT